MRVMMLLPLHEENSVIGIIGVTVVSLGTEK